MLHLYNPDSERLTHRTPIPAHGWILRLWGEWMRSVGEDRLPWGREGGNTPLSEIPTLLSQVPCFTFSAMEIKSQGYGHPKTYLSLWGRGRQRIKETLNTPLVTVAIPIEPTIMGASAIQEMHLWCHSQKLQNWSEENIKYEITNTECQL